MIEKSELHNKINFWLAWVIANSIGLGIGWAAGELFGYQVDKLFGRIPGQLIGFIACEGFIWLARGVILSRMKMFKILNSVEIFAWILGETFGWLAASLSTSSKASLVDITSGTILAYFWGVFVWLIVWLVKVEAPRRQIKLTFPRRALGTISRAGSSIFIIVLMIMSMPLSFTLGETMAKAFGLIIGRALAGLTLGAFLGSITGLAMISLQRWPAWEQ